MNVTRPSSRASSRGGDSVGGESQDGTAGGVFTDTLVDDDVPIVSPSFTSQRVPIVAIERGRFDKSQKFESLLISCADGYVFPSFFFSLSVFCL